MAVLLTLLPNHQPWAGKITHYSLVCDSQGSGNSSSVIRKELADKLCYTPSRIRKLKEESSQKKKKKKALYGLIKLQNSF